MAQYPMNMGLAESEGGTAAGAIVPLSLDAEVRFSRAAAAARPPLMPLAQGKVQYDQLLKQGTRADKVVHATYDALVPVAISHEDERRDLPDPEEVARVKEETAKALGTLVESKLSAALPTHVAKHNAEATFVRYTPANQRAEDNAGAKQRIIRMVEEQKDPMEPPKFKTNKKIPRGPPSPPAPVLHSPPRKVTVQEQEDWKIPPCVSSWKNIKGYTIPLDKRLAADGRGLQDVHINDNFAKFSESLFIAERDSRTAIELRQSIQKKAASKEKDRREEELRLEAQKARDERAGIRPAAHEAAEVAERDKMRMDRSRDRERERRIAAAAPDKRNALARDKERDVSERIALGMPATNTEGGGFDSRLFNKSQGMDSGFKGDDAYDVYDKAFRGEQATSIYRPGKAKDQEYTEEDVDAIRNADRFHRPDKGFSGTEGAGPAKRDGPVQFEKAGDVLGLNSFLNAAKEGSKKRDGDASGGRDGKRSRGTD